MLFKEHLAKMIEVGTFQKRPGDYEGFSEFDAVDFMVEYMEKTFCPPKKNEGSVCSLTGKKSCVNPCPICWELYFSRIHEDKFNDLKIELSDDFIQDKKSMLAAASAMRKMVEADA